MTRIIIADDHQIVIDGLKALLKDQSEIKIVDEAHDGLELIEKCKIHQPDLVLTDIGMDKMDGIEASQVIIKQFSNIKILVLTTYADARSIRKMLKIGVEGYLLKDSGKQDFIQAISEIINGNNFYDQRVTDVIMNSMKAQPKKTAPTPLTAREKEIICLIAEGLNMKEIANQLFLSELTVDSHRKNIYVKLGINKVAMLVRYAVEHGLVE